MTRGNLEIRFFRILWTTIEKETNKLSWTDHPSHDQFIRSDSPDYECFYAETFNFNRNSQWTIHCVLPYNEFQRFPTIFASTWYFLNQEAAKLTKHVVNKKPENLEILLDNILTVKARENYTTLKPMRLPQNCHWPKQDSKNFSLKYTTNISRKAMTCIQEFFCGLPKSFTIAMLKYVIQFSLKFYSHLTCREMKKWMNPMNVSFSDLTLLN
jgi:hypothetical protein